MYWLDEMILVGVDFYVVVGLGWCFEDDGNLV